MATPEPTVFVIDDDPAVRDSLSWLISSVSLPVLTFSSAREFLDAVAPDQAGCALIDVRMPGISGLELQEALAARSHGLSVIIITAHADVPMAIRAMKAGALDFVEKPFNDQDLLELVHKGMEESVQTVRKAERQHEFWQRLDSLTSRERQILEGIIEGDPNKTIAARLCLSQKTVENHRAKMMKKMQAGSLVELVDLVAKLGLTRESP